MPAHRVSNDNTVIACGDLVGQDADKQSYFVRHVALAARDNESVRFGDSITVHHMGPPLERDASLDVHVFGTADLNNDDLNKIELFIEEHFLEQQAQRRRRFANYIVHPHSALSDDAAFRRFSCAGFVLDAYEEAGIFLIDIDAGLPQVTLQNLFVVYPEFERFENNPRMRERVQAPTREQLGLEGEGPWPVLLPGYIFHSLARDTDAIRQGPYTVAEGDQHFPQQD